MSATLLSRLIIENFLIIQNYFSNSFGSWLLLRFINGFEESENSLYGTNSAKNKNLNNNQTYETFSYYYYQNVIVF